MQDSGGYTASGEVPEADAILISTERALRAEVEALARRLDVGEDWMRRIQALLRLEGLIKGGAASLPGFSDAARALQAPITAQLLDRSVLCLTRELLLW